MPNRDPNPGFEAVVAEGVALQAHLSWLRLICVGGTAAALHTRHRYSTDTDHVGMEVRDRFDELRVALTHWEGWKTKRVRRPVSILGERHGFRLGVGQQRRRAPLDVIEVEGLRIPTAEEMLRIKAWMMAERGATRDFLDVAALGDLLGAERAAKALAPLSALYDSLGTETATMRFAQAAMGRPTDEDVVDLPAYRGVIPPYRDLEYVLRRVRELAVPAMERELDAPTRTSEPAAPSSKDGEWSRGADDNTQEQ